MVNFQRNNWVLSHLFIPLSPTKQHHVFAQIKQNLHEMGLAHALLYPAKVKLELAG